MHLVGGPGIDALSRSQRVSNERFKAATGWKPSIPDARVGMRRLVGVDLAETHEIPPAATLLGA